MRRLGPGNRQPVSVEKARLDQNGSLIPVDMLMGNFAVSEMNDDDSCYFYALMRSSDARKEIIYAPVMREPDHHLIDQRVASHSAAYRDDLHVVGLHRNKMMRVEAPQIFRTNPAR